MPKTELNGSQIRVAVTGHRGFIGRHVLAALRVQRVQAHPIHGDVRAPLESVEEFDVLCHLAGLTPARFSRDPSAGFSVNLCGTLQALALCRVKRARLVFASTCGVYRPVEGPVAEDELVDPPTPYAQSKRLAEMLCQTYARQLNVPCMVLRLFNVYGCGQSEDFVIPQLLRSALSGQIVTVYTPDSVRDLVHVTDVATAFWKACQMTENWGVFNIGSGQPWTLRAVIDLIGRLSGKPLPWRPGDGRLDTHPGMWADIRRAEKELRWRPSVEVSEGLREMAMEMGVPASSCFA